MKRVLKFIVLVFLFQVLLGCEKKASSVEVQGNGAEVISEVLETTTQVSTLQEERIKKAKEYDEYIISLQKKHFDEEIFYKKQIPYSISPNSLLTGKADIFYYENGKQHSSSINIFDIKYDERICICKFNLETPKGKKLMYQATLKIDPYRELFEDRTKHHENDSYSFPKNTYCFMGMELLTDIVSKKIDNSDNNFVVGEVNDIDNDEKREKLLSLFEEYENTNYPFYDDRAYNSLAQLQVLDYIKVNLTGSDYDEYLVLYENVPNHKNSYSYPQRLKCLVVENTTVIKDYIIPVNVHYIEKTSGKLSKDGFGFKCSIGHICDYNQNRINEIYFTTVGAFNYMYHYFVEFNGQDFVVKYLYDNIPLNNYYEVDRCILTNIYTDDQFGCKVYDANTGEMVSLVLTDDIKIERIYSNDTDEYIISKMQYIGEIGEYFAN